ncbi:MAG: zinc ribbon domain-containing protein [Phycisphaerae bacterium]|jgi:hypothetical protein
MMLTAGVTTVVVALLVGLLLIFGAVVIGWNASSRAAASQACPRCGQLNVEAARFCANCGTPLR